MGQIDFEVDVIRDDSGRLVAAYGQKATDAHGLPLTEVTLEGRSFSFVLFGGGAGGGAFKADILSDGKSMSGEARAPLGSAPFMLYRTGDAVMPRAIKNTTVSAALEGRWSGSLDAGGVPIGLNLTITNRPNGTASVMIAQGRHAGRRRSQGDLDAAWWFAAADVLAREMITERRGTPWCGPRRPL
jgi:hypothetical protein